MFPFLSSRYPGSDYEGLKDHWFLSESIKDMGRLPLYCNVLFPALPVRRVYFAEIGFHNAGAEVGFVAGRFSEKW